MVKHRRFFDEFSSDSDNEEGNNRKQNDDDDAENPTFVVVKHPEPVPRATSAQKLEDRRVPLRPPRQPYANHTPFQRRKLGLTVRAAPSRDEAILAGKLHFMYWLLVFVISLIVLGEKKSWVFRTFTKVLSFVQVPFRTALCHKLRPKSGLTTNLRRSYMFKKNGSGILVLFIISALQRVLNGTQKGGSKCPRGPQTLVLFADPLLILYQLRVGFLKHLRPSYVCG